MSFSICLAVVPRNKHRASGLNCSAHLHDFRPRNAYIDVFAAHPSTYCRQDNYPDDALEAPRIRGTFAVPSFSRLPSNNLNRDFRVESGYGSSYVTRGTPALVEPRKRSPRRLDKPAPNTEFASRIDLINS